ncbi:sorting nexin-2 isoform X2 [Aplysia californica]|uniref:Sorting nexin-2 isoform X2 n=1 Tax=Aplysia californica TaxID=6500 RepID=A0ABM0JWT4_APLCA|nr:sorting nexin-2 isoform X2 [Aplysia californica]
MADGVEPPPFDNEEDEVKDEDDLFSDAKEKPASPDMEPPQQSDLTANGTPTEPLEDDKDEDDLFKGGSSEIKLDSDDEDVAAKANNDGDMDSGSSPFESEPSPPKSEIFSSPAAESTPKIPVSQETTKKTKVSAPSLKSDEESIEAVDEKETYEIDIKIIESQKMGDGMSAYMTYKIVCKTTNPAFRRPENIVLRRFSDFLGLHAKLAEKHVPLGVIVPPAPEKSVLGMTKVKMSKEESGSADFVERRRAALERYLIRTAAHPMLVTDPDFIEFLEKDGDLPRSTSTSALSGAGVMRLFHKVGESFEKITLKVDESDEWSQEEEWFQEKHQQVEAFDLQLRKLHSSIEALSSHRRELSTSTATFAKSAAMLGNVEEHTALSRALSQLAETEEKIEVLHKDQAEADFFVMAELMKDYVALMQAVKDVFHERIKTYKQWKEAETTLGKKREAKAKFEMQNKLDKVAQAQAEITEWEQKVETGKEDFSKICKNIRKEMTRFEKLRVNDFKNNVIKYLEVLMENQEKLIKYWETFLPEAKAIA